MPSSEISRNAAKSTKGKPRGKPFQSGTDERRNEAGQRSREVVQTAAQARALYVQVLHEPHNAPIDANMSNLELIVRQHVKAAKQGDATQREQMFDRIWGKATQGVEIGGPNGGPIQTQEVNKVPFDYGQFRDVAAQLFGLAGDAGVDKPVHPADTDE